MKKPLEGKRLEWIVFGLFIVLYSIITAFHEPWFDEAQVWQIARCASLREILFEIPHYEGHPAFWSLILAIPAKLGVPFEVGIKSLGLLISSASAYLLIFRTKFPRLARLLIPFTYFFFYQYGVIVRPYGLLLLLMILLGLIFPERDAHPWRVFFVLLLLCLTSAYGIVIAGGLSIGIVWELWRQKKTLLFFRELFRDARTRSLLLLLVCALAITAEIIPRSDTFVQSTGAINSFWLCLLCALFTFPGECFLTFGSWFSMDRFLLQHVNIPPMEFVCFCVIGCVLWIIIICSSSKCNLKFLLIPYILFAVFSAKVYFSTHHLGIVFILFLFWTELLSQDKNRFEIGRTIKRRIAINPRDHILIKRTYVVVVSACVLVPLVWTAWASINDIRYEYSYGRHAKKLLEPLIADGYRLFCGWQVYGSIENESSAVELEPYINVDMVGAPILINAYFPHNTCVNLNGGRDSEGYMHYRIASYQRSLETVKAWRENGAPDIIVSRPDLSLVFGDAISYDDYALVDLLPMDYIWKTTIMMNKIPVYVRKDIAEKNNLEDLSSYLSFFYDGLKITSEMRERFENGEPVEEILKPYLDAMFGPEK